jgi:hypothetical protein
MQKIMLMKICKDKWSQMSSVHVIVDKDDLKECKSKWLFFSFQIKVQFATDDLAQKNSQQKHKPKLNKLNWKNLKTNLYKQYYQNIYINIKNINT